MSALNVGDVLGPRTIASVDPELMKLFAEILDDPNPIHLDPAAVRAMGLGDRVVNQGPANFGYVLAMLREAAPEAAVRKLDVRLGGNVFAGDRLIAAGRVEQVEEAAGERVLACRVWLENDGGTRVLEGSATLVVPA
ncbi:MAG TPA: MaoC family dehydratase [Conexibacter sp.]|jgi:acyl dehydratase